MGVEPYKYRNSVCWIFLFLVAIVAALPAYTASTPFDSISFEDLKLGTYSIQKVALDELESGETIFLKTADGSYAKLQIAYTKSYSHGSTTYSVSIKKGTCYSSSGAIISTFANLQMPPQRRISVTTGSTSSHGEIVLVAEVPSYQVTKIIYTLEAEDGAMISRCAESRSDATITVHIKDLYFAFVYVDNVHIGSILSNQSKTFTVDAGKHVLRVTHSGYKDWERTITVVAGQESTYTVVMREKMALQFIYSPIDSKVGESITFDASKSKGDIVKYQWDWDGDGAFDTETGNPSVSHTFTTSRYYTVVLQATDSDGDTDKVTKTFLVKGQPLAPPVAVFSYSLDAPGVNKYVHFDSHESYDPNGIIVSREWDFGDGKTLTTSLSSSIGHTYAKAGTYIVSLTVIDNDGLRSSTSAVSVVVPGINIRPTAEFTYNVLSESGAKLLIAPRVGERVIFDPSASSDSDGKVVKCEWDWDSDGIFDDTSSVGPIEHRFMVPGDHDVTLRVTDEKNGSDTVTKTVHVDLALTPPKATFSFTPSSPTTRDTVRFLDSSTDVDGKVTAWSWDFGDGSSSTKPDPTHMYSDGGSYTVSLVVEDNDGQTDTTSRIISVNAVPRASFEFAAVSASGAKLLIVPHVGDRIRFDPSGSTDSDGEIVSYEWDWDSDGIYDNAITTGTIEYAFDLSGRHRVSLRVTDNKGATDTVTRDFNVPPAVPQFSYQPTVPTIRDVISFAYSAEGTDAGIISLKWVFGDGSTSTARDPKHQYKDKGIYTVTLTVTGHDNLTERFSQQITVKNIPPEADFTYHAISEGGAKLLTVPHVGDAIDFDASGSSDQDGEIMKYEWDWESDGAYDIDTTSETIEHRFDRDGTQPVTLRITDNDGATGTLTKEVSIVNDPPEAVFGYTPASPTVKDEVRFDGSKSQDSDGEIVTWEWNFGDGARKSGQVVTHSYESSGDYEIALTVGDNAGATDTNTKTISITPLVPPEATFEINPDSPTTQDTISFVDHSEDLDGEVVSWEWSFGDGENAVGKEASHSYDDDGSYTVTLTVTDNDDLSGTASQEITVENVPPKAHFTVSPERRVANATITFDASSSKDPDGSIKTYEWDFDDDGETDMTGVNVTHVFEHGGTFPVTLYVTDDDGARATLRQQVGVRDLEIKPHTVWALVIGVAKYPDLPGHDLTYTVIDAQAIYDFLIGPGGLKEDHVKLLLNNKASFSAVRAGLEWLRKQAQPDDLVIFYFSGHGYQGKDDNGDEQDGLDEFLVLYDTQQGYIDSTAFRDDEFGKFLDKVSSQHVLVLFDSCFSGGASRGIKGLQSGAKPVPGYTDIFHDFSLEGKLVLSASTEAQQSWEDSKLGHGVFTYFLLQGLNGEADEDKDYQITVEELHEFVAKKVDEFVEREKQASQEPQLTGKGRVGVIVTTVNQPPQVEFSWSPREVIKEGDEVVFHDESEDRDGKIAGWEWYFDDGSISSEQNPTHTFSRPGKYAVSLEVTDDDGETAKIAHDVLVVKNQPPEPDFIWLPEDPFVSETVYFIDRSTDDGKITSWEWDFGNGETASVDESSHSVTTSEYLGAGTYQVALTVKDDSGVKQSLDKEISIREASYVEAHIIGKRFFVYLALAERERAKVGAGVLIYRRRVSAVEGKVLRIPVASGTIIEVEGGEATVAIDTGAKHIPVMINDFVELN